MLEVNGNLPYSNSMELRNWLFLFLISCGIVAASIAPFLPGPSNDFSSGISQFAQMIGYIGLVFIPFGLIWLVIEVRNKKGQKLNRWTNGYYPALMVLTPVFLFLPLQLVRAISEGRTFDLWPLAIIFSVVAFIIYRIQKLKRKIDYRFNPAPLYIVLVPLIALLTSQFAVEKAAEFSRYNGIEMAEPLIEAIEKYKTEQSEYPDNLEELEGKYILEIPKINMMGVKAYRYEKRNGAYLLSFEQVWHWNATEVVVYNTSGEKGIKSNYKSFPTKFTNWRYHLAD